MKKKLNVNGENWHQLKRVLFSAVFALVIISCSVLSPVFAQGQTPQPTTEKTETRTEETVTSEYSLPNGVTVKESTIKEGTITDGNVTISGKQTTEAGNLTDLKVPGNTTVLEEIKFINQVTPRTMLKAVFIESGANDPTRENGILFQGEHKIRNDRLKIFVSGGWRDTISGSASSLETRLRHNFGKFTSVEVTGKQDTAPGIQSNTCGVQFSKQVTPAVSFGIGRQIETTGKDQLQYKTSLSVQKKLGKTGTFGAWCSTTENEITDDTNQVGLSLEKEVVTRQLKFFVNYDYTFNNETNPLPFHKAAVGVRKETRYGDVSFKYLHETPNVLKWNNTDKGFFMGLTKKF